MIPLFARSGPAVETLRDLRRAHVLRRWRIDIRGPIRGATRLIIGIGQVHPVLSGRYDRRQAKRIGKVQSQIFALCTALKERLGIRAFGQEGLSSPDGSTMYARLPAEELQRMHERLMRVSPESFLQETSLAWRSALQRGNAQEARRSATALNGLSVLQALDASISVFPIEQRDVHGAVSDAIATLSAEIARIESSPEHRSVQKKQGKGLTKQEYQVAVLRTKLIKEFNRTLAHPERDKSILREVTEHATPAVTVFVLGNAHRAGIVRLAGRHLPSDTLFVWLTPPGLWWWSAMVRRVGVSVCLLLSGLVVFLPR